MVKLYEEPIGRLYLTKRRPPKFDAFGVEIEIEPKNKDILFSNHPSSWWSVKTDGSLRNGGYEIVSKPLPFMKIDEALNDLQKLVDFSTVTEESPRTSTHVHLNFGNRTLSEFFSFACLYLLYEDLILLVSGQSRKGNNFAIQFQGSIQYDGVLRSIRNVDKPEVPHSERYCSFNMAPLQTFNTVEIRCMRGLANVEDIKNWLVFLSDLYTLAVKSNNPSNLLNNVYESGSIVLDSMKMLLKREGYNKEAESIKNYLDKNFSIAFELVANHPSLWNKDSDLYDVRSNKLLVEKHNEDDLLALNSNYWTQRLNKLLNIGKSDYLFDYEAAENDQGNQPVFRTLNTMPNADIQNMLQRFTTVGSSNAPNWVTFRDDIEVNNG